MSFRDEFKKEFPDIKPWTAGSIFTGVKIYYPELRLPTDSLWVKAEELVKYKQRVREVIKKHTSHEWSEMWNIKALSLETTK